MTHLNYRNMYIWPPTKLDNISWSFTFDSTFNYNIWSFWSFEAITSHCESDIWHFTLMNKPLAFWINIFFNIKSLTLFPSQILKCATGFCSSISLFIWRFTFGELFLAKTQKIVGRYIDTSICMSQDQQNHSLIIHDKFKDLFITIT